MYPIRRLHVGWALVGNPYHSTLDTRAGIKMQAYLGTLLMRSKASIKFTQARMPKANEPEPEYGLL